MYSILEGLNGQREEDMNCKRQFIHVKLKVKGETEVKGEMEVKGE